MAVLASWRVALLVLVVLGSQAMASWCFNRTGWGTPNTLQFDDGTGANARVVKSTRNGVLKQVGSTSKGNVIHIAHVWGRNNYDFGFAAGQLLGGLVNRTITTALDRLYASTIRQLEQDDPKIPPWVAELIAVLGIDGFLDHLYELNKAWVDPGVFDEIRGLSDATGTDAVQLRRMAFFGMMIRAACSMVGADGSATLDGHRVFLRAFDWETGVGLQDAPVITVYHPLEPSLGIPWANIAWAGYIGTLTGVNSANISSGQIGVGRLDRADCAAMFLNESWHGEPFVLTLRRTMQRATSVAEVQNMWANAHRTCHIFVGAAQGHAPSQNGTSPGYFMAASSAERIFFYDDWTAVAPTAAWHPPVRDTASEWMSCVCEEIQRKGTGMLKQFHGHLEPELIVRNITAVVQTGNLVTWAVDLDTGVAFVANARPDGFDDPAWGDGHAYTRAFVKLNINEWWAEPRPTVDRDA